MARKALRGATWAGREHCESKLRSETSELGPEAQPRQRGRLALLIMATQTRCVWTFGGNSTLGGVLIELIVPAVKRREPAP